jgi:phasin family protein
MANQTNPTNPTNPFGDVTKMMEQFKMPGIDMTAIMQAQRKGIESLVEANQAVFASMQALAKRQTEMMTEAMQDMQHAVKNGVGGITDPTKQVELVRKGFEKTLAGMKELAEMARQAQSDAMARMMQSAADGMQNVKALAKSK